MTLGHEFERRYEAVMPENARGLDELVKESQEIVQKAFTDTEPYAVCLMLSGGDDSITSLLVARMLGIKIDYIIHGVTGTGLPAVREYVAGVAENFNIPIAYANAGDKFERYVLRKGFFGRGVKAHSFSYHLLKSDPFDSAISKYLRKRKQGRKIILLNGVRVEESENRADNFGDNPYRWDKGNYWVNIIHWWTKRDCLKLIEAESMQRNPVSVHLGRSGECNCGTMQTMADILAAGEFDPAWGEWMTGLRKAVVAKFGWDISQTPTKDLLPKLKKDADFMPMCVGCKSRSKHTLFENEH